MSLGFGILIIESRAHLKIPCLPDLHPFLANFNFKGNQFKLCLKQVADKKAEGSWDEVMKLIGQAHTLVHQNGVLRVQTDIRAGTR